MKKSLPYIIRLLQSFLTAVLCTLWGAVGLSGLFAIIWVITIPEMVGFIVCIVAISVLWLVVTALALLIVILEDGR